MNKETLLYAAPMARVLLALIFITAGLSKITGYAGTAAYMDMMGDRKSVV